MSHAVDQVSGWGLVCGASTAGAVRLQQATPSRLPSPTSYQKAHSAQTVSRKTALCTRHLTENRILQPATHGKAHSGVSLSRKSALCVWVSPKGAFCKRAVAQSAPFREGPCAECAFPHLRKLRATSRKTALWIGISRKSALCTLRTPQKPTQPVSLTKKRILHASDRAECAFP